MKDIEELRKEIDAIDSKLVGLFEDRMDLALRIAMYKKENNMEVLNSSREEQVISKAKEQLRNKNLNDSVEKFLKCIMQISREIQSEKL